MKSFLLFSVSTVACFSIAFAQESLFPELDMGDDTVVSQNTMVEEEQLSQVEEKVEDMTVIEEKKETISPAVSTTTPAIPRQAKVISGTGAEKIVNGEGEGKEAKEEAEKIFIALNNIKTNVTAVRAVSNCQADFVLLNGFKKKKVENFSVTLTIGSTEKTFSFKNVAPQSPTGEHFMMIGKDCENILNTPQTNITKCQIPGMTEKKCIEKVNYISLPTASGEL